jgi:CHAD domain-containing protein
MVSTGLGAAIALVSTLLADKRRWSRERSAARADSRRVLYGQHLHTLSIARSALRQIVRNPTLVPDQRRHAAREAFEPCYGLRYEITIAAPAFVVTSAEEAFQRLRDLRTAVSEGEAARTPGYIAAADAYDEALRQLRVAMRRDLGADD